MLTVDCSRLRNAGISMILAVGLIAALPAALTYNTVFGGITEQVGGRADLELELRASGEDIDGATGSLGNYMTGENVAHAYRDAGKIPYIFDRVIAPFLDSFAERHKEELDGRYIDRIQITFNSVTNGVGIATFLDIERKEGRINTWVAESNKVSSEEMQHLLDDSAAANATSAELNFLDAFLITIPAQFTYSNLSDGVSTYGDSRWKSLIPNASARVAYLSEQVKDTINTHRSEITSDVKNEEGQGVVLGRINAIMFEDMVRVMIESHDQSTAVSNSIAEYYTAQDFVVSSPLYLPRGLGLEEPIYFVKPATKGVTTAVTAEMSVSNVSLFEGNATVTYPGGRAVPMSQLSLEMDKYDYGKAIYGITLGPKDPAGIYSVVMWARNPERISFVSVDVGEDPPVTVSPVIDIVVGGGNGSGILPIHAVENHMIPRYSIVDEIRTWMMAPSWEATYPPNYDFYLNVTDGDGNDLLDRSKPFSIRDALSVAELDCGFTENGRKDIRELRTSVPVDIPLVRNVTTGEAVLVSYPVAGLAPQHDGFYNLTFASLYDPGAIDLPGNLTLSHGSPTTVTSQGGDRCTIVNPEQFENKFNNAYARHVTFWYNGTASDSR